MRALILLILFTVISCVPSGSGGKRNSSNSASSSDTSSTDSTPTSLDPPSWFTTTTITSNLQIDYDVSSSIYLRGETVETYLDSTQSEVNGTTVNVTNSHFQDRKHCIIFEFEFTGQDNVFRERYLSVAANNIEFFQSSTGETERLFRLDFHDSVVNRAFCEDDTVSAGDAFPNQVYSIQQLCSGTECPSGSARAESLVLVESTSDGSGGFQILHENINFADVKINPFTQTLNPNSTINLKPIVQFNTSSGTGSGNTCTQAFCTGQGFDCCLESEGICAMDGELRPNATSHPDYDQSQASVGQSCSNYVFWDEIYYVCPTTPNANSCSDGNTGDDGSAFEQIVKDFNCQEGTDTATNCCETGNLTNCASSFQTETIERIQIACGCNSPGNCEEYKYVATTDTNGTIVEVTCQTEDPNDPVIDPERTVSLSTKSVPHRYFRLSDGTAVDDYEVLQTTFAEQEGNTFNYTDPGNGIGLEDESELSMNLILGMKASGGDEFNLNAARPALTVDVEFDKTYIIGATSGSIIPCPFCQRDQWFSQFSAFPTVPTPDGIIAVGHITRRQDLSENNTTNANYEDQLYGRACFVPPTMIPNSHASYSTTQVQRLNRLQTQAAMFYNGYRRDWYGFNYGALIGSFDGVTWFAVGNGRRVRATSNKLFLAINASFGDRTIDNSYQVNVSEDRGGAITADFDYDPTLSFDDPRQNQAGSCQQFHQCETDTDCVTQLGWEYMCADVTRFETNWPTFDSDANEDANTTTQKSFSSLIVGGLAGTSTKRCVYRGMGAACSKNYDTDFASPKLQKFMTCAPNFYCAGISESAFNTTINRDTSNVSIITYGHEADNFGRHSNYANPNGNFPAEVQANFNDSFNNAYEVTTDIGLCMPGKDISQQEYINQHNSKDTSDRTDFINQIGSCDSTITSTDPTTIATRFMGCPIFDEDGDYIFQSLADFAAVANRDTFANQNACGGSSQDSFSGDNIFSSIEAGIIGTGSLISPTMVLDACLKRAGQPCFTDLDCSPNRLHANVAGQQGVDSFGTLAEKNYWEEFLVCGQESPKPVLGTDEFNNYDKTKNRCVRPLKENITIETRRDEFQGGGSVQEDTTKPIGDQFSIYDPQNSRRYSRFMVIFEEIVQGTIPAPFIDYAGCADVGAPADCSDGDGDDYVIERNTTSGSEVNANQWMAYNRTAQRTCAGGGWIRKFSDGTNDWTQHSSKLSFSVENFNCLNYANEWIYNRPSNADSGTYSRDVAQACRETTQGGCPQVSFNISDGYNILNRPTRLTVANEASLADLTDIGGRLATTIDYSTIVVGTVFGSNGENISGERIPGLNNFGSTSIEQNSYNPGTAGETSTLRYYNAIMCSDNAELVLNIPSYINLHDNAQNNLLSVGVSLATDAFPGDISDYFDSGLTLATNAAGPISGTIDVTAPTSLGDATLISKQITVTVDNNARTISFSCAAGGAGGPEMQLAFPILTFVPQNAEGYSEDGATTLAATDDGIGAMPGSEIYYTSKLARYELVGIPQITFEPLYCSSNTSELLPGLYTSATLRSDLNPGGTYEGLIDTAIDTLTATPLNADNFVGVNYGDPANNIVDRIVLTQDEIAFSPVFSEDEFMCCSTLGTTVTDNSLCCSGYTKEEDDGSRTCALPSTTNLNVYFNRFVSGEGEKSDDQPTGLEDSDFSALTGEPAYSQATFDKIFNLGQQFCDNEEDIKVRTGAVIGNYYGRPNSTTYVTPPNTSVDDPALTRYGFADDIEDGAFDGASGVEFTERKGTGPFQEGYRWNNQLYCK